MKTYCYAGPLDGSEHKISPEPRRGELWVFTVPPFLDEQYVYDCQGRFVHIGTAIGKRLFRESKAKR
jgi:hypothetical protein